MPTAIQNSSLTRVHKLTYTPIPDVMDNEALQLYGDYPLNRLLKQTFNHVICTG